MIKILENLVECRELNIKRSIEVTVPKVDEIAKMEDKKSSVQADCSARKFDDKNLLGFSDPEEAENLNDDGKNDMRE